MFFKKTNVAVLLFMFVFPLSVYSQHTYYVAVDGNDNRNGSFTEPLRTISHALNLVRGKSGETTIYLREGIYRMDCPLTLIAREDNATLTIRSYPGERAVLSGAKELKLEWKKHKGGIYVAKVRGMDSMDMLIVNGGIRQMARYPNYDSTAVRFNGTSPDATSPQRIRTWKNPKGGFLHAMHAHDWGDFHYMITGKDSDSTLTMTGGHQNNRKMGLSHYNRMVENIFEELDAEGEWYYDREKSLLYYYPPEGEDIHHATVETPQVKSLIEMRGSVGNPVKNITLRDLIFTGTMRTFMEKYEPLLRSDWTIYRGATVFMEGTENCTISNCDFSNLGGNGLFFSRYNRNDIVSGCHFTRIGASAVLFVGDTSAVRSPSFEYWQSVDISKMDFASGPKNLNYPFNCTVEDNLIHGIGLFEKQITGVELSMCRNITVSHNSIYDVPRAGINVSEGTWGGHIIEYNDIFDTVKETGDHGSFNSWGRDRFWHADYSQMCDIAEKHPELILADVIEPIVIRNNRLRCDRGWDIDLDDGSSNYHIYNNLCLNGGIKLREGFYRTVENNILINNTLHPHVWFRQSGDVFARNIVMSAYHPINLQGWGRTVDGNIFASEADLINVRKQGTDSCSITATVRFSNPANGDFSISRECVEVFRMGFRNFPMDRFGVLSPRLKAMVRKPLMPQPIAKENNSESKILDWHGWAIKDIETLGEQSATGMDSQRGVYVVNLTKYDSPLRDYLKPNDVILRVNDRKTDNVDALFRITDKKKEKGVPLKLIIFRNQKEYEITVYY
ncbi:Right handed beta helix region [Bacteroides finegoldii]|uniref:Right handed beta helix domain-containing protein n=2 Tax=Bacteroides finegoldii TaxID=338188 RepID=K5D7F5_9BACE|nr:hypothetical protein HMPREF1057_04171 [Bacteroides finegoldii CL09T03C10]